LDDPLDSNPGSRQFTELTRAKPKHLTLDISGPTGTDSNFYTRPFNTQ